MRLAKYTPNSSFGLYETSVNEEEAPSYAILLHTWWDGHEVIFDDLSTVNRKDKADYSKIMFYARQAQRDGLDYC